MKIFFGRIWKFSWRLIIWPIRMLLSDLVSTIYGWILASLMMAVDLVFWLTFGVVAIFLPEHISSCLKFTIAFHLLLGIIANGEAKKTWGIQFL